MTSTLTYNDIEPIVLSYCNYNNFTSFTIDEKEDFLESTKEMLRKLSGNTSLTLPSIEYIDEKLQSFTETLSLNEVKELIGIQKSNLKKEGKLSFKKSLLTTSRLDYDKLSFINKLATIFSQTEISKMPSLESKNTNILEVPISDLNLEGWYKRENLQSWYDYLQNIIENIVDIQQTKKYGTVRILFLGNLITRTLCKEQDFKGSLVYYNLILQTSYALLETYVFLKQIFSNVEFVFSLEKSNYREQEMIKEYFNNYNINAERIIPILLKSKLHIYNLQDSIKDLYDDTYSSIYTYWQNSEYLTIGYGDYKWKSLDKSLYNDLKLDELEKRYCKENHISNRNTRVYIWGSDLLITSDRHRDIRIIPSIYNDSSTTIPFFEIDETWTELGIHWVTPSTNTNYQFNNFIIDVENDIEYYSFIKDTILSTKSDWKPLIIQQ